MAALTGGKLPKHPIDGKNVLACAQRITAKKALKKPTSFTTGSMNFLGYATEIGKCTFPTATEPWQGSHRAQTDLPGQYAFIDMEGN